MTLEQLTENVTQFMKQLTTRYTKKYLWYC